MIVLGILACSVWAYLLLGRGGFWRAAERDRDPVMRDGVQDLPTVVAVVPARDEVAVIGDCVASLLRQDYAGSFSVIVVDDDSSDGTAAAARRAAAASAAEHRLWVIASAARPPGWTGKLWALECGLTHLARLGVVPEFLLFTDADIVHERDSLRALVDDARRDGAVLVSRMARLRCRNAVERMFMPAFVFFFQMLYPFAWVNQRRAHTAAAAGGCILLARHEIERAGGLTAIRGAIIDDCALARLMKERGGIRLSLTDRVHSVRTYDSLTDIRRMIVRSAYAQLRFSPVLLALTVVTMLMTYIVPPVLALLARGPAQVLGLAAWLAMALAFRPTLRFYRVSSWWGLALPGIAAAYLAFTLESAYRAAIGRAGEWKGRVYPARRA